MHVSPSCASPVLILQFTSSICIPRPFCGYTSASVPWDMHVYVCVSVPGSWRQLVILLAIYTQHHHHHRIIFPGQENFPNTVVVVVVAAQELELEVESSIFQQSFASNLPRWNFRFTKRSSCGNFFQQQCSAAVAVKNRRKTSWKMPGSICVTTACGGNVRDGATSFHVCTYVDVPVAPWPGYTLRPGTRLV